MLNAVFPLLGIRPCPSIVMPSKKYGIHCHQLLLVNTRNPDLEVTAAVGENPDCSWTAWYLLQTIAQILFVCDVQKVICHK
jgi:hypothetical protein